MPKPLVSFVVLNWNGLEDTLRCLNSLRNQSYKNYEIIVVDNGSVPKQKADLAKISDILLVDLPKNNGFTGGQIAALKVAKGEYIALINNDSVIDKDWTKNAVAVFGYRKSAAVVGGRAYNWRDDNREVAFSTKNSFYSYQIINLITGHTRTLDYGDVQGDVNSISGSGVMIRRKVIDKLGYFDNNFFAYYEETNLFARYKRAGYEIVYEPTMRTWHKIAQSTKSKPGFYLYYMHRNRFLFAVKNYDRHYLFSFLRNYITEWIRATLHTLKHRKNSSEDARQMVRAGLSNAKNLTRTLISRRGVQRLGSTYSELLLTDLYERISVVIPCHNYAAYVGEAIESVLAQDMPAFEIIVINDGSTDDSLKVIQKYKNKVTIVNQKNIGVIATKNKGMKLATGDWIIYLDADDIMAPNYILKLVAAARQQNADISYSGMQFFGGETGEFTSRPFSEYSILKGNYINNSALIRRSTLMAIGGYNQAMSFGYEDWELYVHLSRYGAKFAYTREPLLHYRRHPNSSRDIKAQEKLTQANEVIRELHPSLFTFRHRMKDIVHSVLSFHKRRTLLQVVRDLRYIFITNLDKRSQSSPLLTKILGFSRLLANGKYSVIFSKIMLNISRLKNKLIRR